MLPEPVRAEIDKLNSILLLLYVLQESMFILIVMDFDAKNLSSVYIERLPGHYTGQPVKSVMSRPEEMSCSASNLVRAGQRKIAPAARPSL
ncbi:hypothetical protein AB434_0317 [Heyndrickxia coagulans]|jgi:hypothetical protein|uniref:Uncharacterized protein n=2 Tax=Heyndrickxia TaxID=2837504 RepID=A0AAN0T434_HEYCO|nr:hypothetical protein SB48_HM08orf01345 [Heyndrickxia coagulans]AKN52722.1 hypothetical protein AB434_0317 [Heyndrickxia coagulans]ATW82183.1 hypothetical protein CIW84_03735 [Heyndrickxia coagulans]AVD57153.1 hypothetical protein C3766_14220 [Heyndrickxia coagulans]KGB29398.1 hypothetical protein IE89_11550 [Heyndrickxia coagulans]